LESNPAGINFDAVYSTDDVSWYRAHPSFLFRLSRYKTEEDLTKIVDVVLAFGRVKIMLY